MIGEVFLYISSAKLKFKYILNTINGIYSLCKNVIVEMSYYWFEKH